MALGDAVSELLVKVLPDMDGFGDKLATGVKKETKGALGTIGKASTAGLGVIAAGGAALAAVGAQFDEAYDQIRTTTGAVGEELKGLEGSFKNVAKNVPASFEETSTAVSGLAQRLDLTGAPLESLSEQMIRLSQLTETDLGTAIDSVTGFLNGAGIEAKDYEATLDQLFRVTQATGISYTELTDALAKGGALFRQVGFSTEQSASFLGLMDKAGLKTADSMTALTKVVKQAEKDGRPASEVFNEIWAAIQGAPDIASASSIAIEAFGAKAGPKLAEQLRTSAFAYEDWGNAITDSGDTIKKAGEETDDWQQSLQKLKNRALIALEPVANRVFSSIGDTLENSVAPAFEDLLPLITGFLDAIARIPGPVMAAIIGLLLVGATVGKIVGPIMQVVKIIQLLTLVLSTNPYILIIAATVLLVILIVKNWETIKTTIISTVQVIWQFLQMAWDAIKNIFMAALNFIVSYYTFIWNTILGVTMTVWNAISGYYRDRINNIKSFLQGLWDKLTAVWNFIMSLPDKARDAWNKIVGFVRGAVNELKELLGELAAAADKALGPLDEIVGGAAGIVGKGLSLLPFAEGGIPPTNRASIVGERGPELFTPGKTGRITSTEDLMKLIGELPGGGVVVHGPLLEVREMHVRDDSDVTNLSRSLARDTVTALRALGAQS